MISCYSCQLDYQGRVTKNFWLMYSCCLLLRTYVLLFVLVWSKVISLYFSFQSPRCPYYLFHLSYNDQSNDGLMLLLLSCCCCCCCCCLMSSKVSSLYFLFLVYNHITLTSATMTWTRSQTNLFGVSFLRFFIKSTLVHFFVYLHFLTLLLHLLHSLVRFSSMSIDICNLLRVSSSSPSIITHSHQSLPTHNHQM